MLGCRSTISKFTVRFDSMSTKLLFPKTSGEPSLNTREFCFARGTTTKNIRIKLWKRLCPRIFSQGECKSSVDPTASCFLVNWVLTFFSTSELLYPNWRIRLRLLGLRLSSYVITDNPNVSLGIVFCSLYTRRIVLKDDYCKKRMDIIAYTPVEFN